MNNKISLLSLLILAPVLVTLAACKKQTSAQETTVVETKHAQTRVSGACADTSVPFSDEDLK